MYYERNLPHWHPLAKDLFITWRLHGTLPLPIIEQIRKNELPASKRFLLFDRELDRAAFGASFLADPALARIVVRALMEAQQRGMCELHSWVVIPNHVHVLLAPRSELRKVTKWIKGVTAFRINKMLKRSGRRLWQEESFDHWIRSSAQFERVRSYIETNPVKAGLVASPAEWPWSSAAQ